MGKETNKIQPVVVSKPFQQRSFDAIATKQMIRDILAENIVAFDSIQPRYLSNFIDRVIESLRSGKAINKDVLEQFFRKEIFQNQTYSSKSQINFGSISVRINQLKNNLPAASSQSISHLSETQSPTKVGLGKESEVQGELQVRNAAKEPEMIIQKIILWVDNPPPYVEVSQSSGFAEVKRGTATSIIPLPKRTDPEAELKELVRQMPREELAQQLGRILSTFEWYSTCFIPAQSGLTEKFTKGKNVKGHEVIEVLDGVIRSIEPNFDMGKIINPDNVVTRSDLVNLGNQINLKILMPRGLFSAITDGGLCIGFMLKEPEVLVTPKGNNMPMHKIYPLVGEFGYAYSDHEMVVYPYFRDASFAEGLTAAERNWANYKAGLLRGISFTKNPDAVISWVGLQFLEHSQDIVIDQRTDAVNEELAHHDLHTAFKEKEGTSFDTHDITKKVEGIKKLLKPNSVLLRELENIPQREINLQTALVKQEEFCHAVDEIYAKLVSLEISPFPPFTLQDCICNTILPVHEELQYEPGQYAIARKFLAQFLWKELNGTHENHNASREEWGKYLDTAIKGTDESSDKNAIRIFNKKLTEVAHKIVSEHFVV